MLTKVSIENARKIERSYGVLYWLVIDDDNFLNLRVHLISVEPGKHTSKQSHPQEEVIYIVSGTALVSSDKEEIVISAGEAVLVPPHEIHRITNASQQEQLLYLAAMSPPRTPGSVKYYE